MSKQDRWKNRRRMAWLAVLSGLFFFPGLLLFTDSDQLGVVAAPFYVFVTGVVMSYIGWATYDDVQHKNDTELSDWPESKGGKA